MNNMEDLKSETKHGDVNVKWADKLFGDNKPDTLTKNRTQKHFNTLAEDATAYVAMEAEKAKNNYGVTGVTLQAKPKAMRKAPPPKKRVAAVPIGVPAVPAGVAGPVA